MASPPVARRPAVVVSCSERAYRRFQDDGARELRRYVECLERAGARVVLAAPGQRPAALGAYRGLLLPGGPDVHPRRYGQSRAGSEGMDEALDELELDLVREAQARGWPILGICRGMQLLNVALGGSLEQHVEGHRRAGDTASARHAIELAPASKLGRLLGLGGTISVNSRHHQAVTSERLAPGLGAAACAPGVPGIVEAVEGPGEPWLIGVQCHPERSDEVPPEFSRLFQALVREAAGA